MEEEEEETKTHTQKIGKVRGRESKGEGKKTVRQVNELEALRGWKSNRLEWKKR